MRAVFMGTPDFAVKPLKALYEAGVEIVCVVTQPDKPKGRHKTPTPCPVKEEALSLGLTVITPERLKNKDEYEKLREYPADIFIVAAFGQILPKEVLIMPKYGCINIHASLLPRYRGAAPIQKCILDGEDVTGVTIMQMGEGLDTGDILYQKEIEISADETGGSLFDRLSDLGAEMITEVLPMIEKGEINPIKQDESLSSYAGMIKKEDGRIDFSKNASEIERQIRAMYPWPGTFTTYKGRMLKIIKAGILNDADVGKDKAEEAEEKTEEKEAAGKNETESGYGIITSVSNDGITVKTGKGSLLVKELQLEGKKRMSAEEFLRGNRMDKGERFGE